MTRPHRNHAYDNLRTLMVLLIVLLHAACAYAVGIPWWHAQDAKSPVFDVTIVTLDVFVLPVLFFVSGLFARSTLERHGTAGFLANKLRRLGLPVLVLSVFYLPTMVYVGYVRRVPDHLGFFGYWLRWVASLRDWGFAVITNMRQGADYADRISPHHLWFLSLLLLFFLGYVLWRTVLPVSCTVRRNRLIPAAALAVFLGFAAVNLLVQDWAWARLGPFILFQPTRIPVYLGMFVFGILFRPYMDGPRPFPGPWWAWLIPFAAATAGILVMMRTFMTTLPPIPPGQAALHGALRAVAAVAGAGCLVNLAALRLNRPARWRESLSASSYDIFLWHMPLVVFVQAWLAPAPLPLGVKALLAFLLPSGFLWAASRAAARTGPLLWGGFVAAVFLGFCLASA
ncbi:MAG: acyltransferase [Pseudodesulfovibrio sp.]|uniref:acyltransferase family protein n=1 Tax=Pseudodesulfovibrio sp. TaxID=2035812 RepID=UPI003D0AB087